jgi:hypothetical protein
MKTLFTFMLACAATGCTSSSYYLPVDSRIAREEYTSCSGAKYGYAALPLSIHRTLRLSIVLEDDQIVVRMSTRLREGERLRLLEPNLTLESTHLPHQTLSVPLSPWENSVKGIRGALLYAKEVPVTEEITWQAPPNEGLARAFTFNLFGSTSRAAAKGEVEYTVLFPPFEVDGAATSREPFVVRLHRESGVSGCLQ